MRFFIINTGTVDIHGDSILVVFMGKPPPPPNEFTSSTKTYFERVIILTETEN